jgi:hypothetical protein
MRARYNSIETVHPGDRLESRQVPFDWRSCQGSQIQRHLLYYWDIFRAIEMAFPGWAVARVNRGDESNVNGILLKLRKRKQEIVSPRPRRFNHNEIMKQIGKSEKKGNLRFARVWNKFRVWTTLSGGKLWLKEGM